jgi:uncharacterized protein YyaL (SSP411 family)
MPNALAQERSAYLRQHQSNPVDWLPWGEAALTRAKEHNKPILLSVGYSACHWCHVMARESFADAETATLMNELFVNVKVDREERPDIDAIYIRALQAMGRRGGWPLTMFLTPDGKPFWGGTYFPREEQADLPAFRDVLKYVHEAYRAAPEASAKKGEDLIAELMSASQGSGAKPKLTTAVADSYAAELLEQVDPDNGGLRGTSKFPYPALFRFLWHQGERSHRPEFQEAVVLTLDKIAMGGLYDHVGGGFFRYAVDPRWEIPHFEKMLYDNALLLSLYGEVSRKRKNLVYRDVVRRTVGWLLREMRVDDGALACSLAAESEDGEGAYYLLRAHDIDAALGDASSTFRRRYFDYSADFNGGKILNRSGDTSPDANQAVFLDQCDRLLAARATRSPPARDDKIVADWNGLAIAALTEVSVVFEEPAWLEVAESVFAAIALRASDHHGLHHSWNGEQAGSAAILDDYANMAHAAVTLFEVTGNARYLRHAETWVDYCLAHFSDPRGGFYHTADTAKFLVARIREGQDTVTPSGNGVMAHVLARLHLLTGNDRYARAAQALFNGFGAEIEREAFLLASIIDAQQFSGQPTQVTIVGDFTQPAAKSLLRAAQRNAPVDRVISMVGLDKKLPDHHPAAGKVSRDGNAAAYVCVGATCSLPISNPDQLTQVLKDAHGPRSV